MRKLSMAVAELCTDSLFFSAPCVFRLAAESSLLFLGAKRLALSGSVVFLAIALSPGATASNGPMIEFIFWASRGWGDWLSTTLYSAGDYGAGASLLRLKKVDFLVASVC